jgi:hypothetical protein
VLFYGFLIVAALGLVLLFLRSGVFRQLHRGHGASRPPFSTARDHGLAHSDNLPRVDPPPTQPRAPK